MGWRKGASRKVRVTRRKARTLLHERKRRQTLWEVESEVHQLLTTGISESLLFGRYDRRRYTDPNRGNPRTLKKVEIVSRTFLQPGIMYK